MKAKIKSLFLTGFPAALTALLFVVVFAWAWVEPTQAPPKGNVPAPLNVGPTGQAKRGNLMLNTDGSLEYGLLIPYGKVGIGTTAPAEKLDVAGNAKIEGNLTINNSHDGNLYIGDSNGSNAQLCLNGECFTKADLLAAGGSGCSDNPPHDCYIGVDLDGDGYTTVEGDCDERCENCYSGSTEYTSSPDGKDQDCDGNIDEIDVVKIKQCGDSSTWRPVSKPDVISACKSYCSSKGLAYAQIECGGEFQPNAHEVAHELDFSDCSRGDINYDFWKDPPACGKWQACYCKVYR